jgi:hypothetical protein
MTRRGHASYAGGWLSIAAVLLLVTVHAAVFGFLSGRGLSVAAAAIIGVIGLKYMWWKRRRSPKHTGESRPL